MELWAQALGEEHKHLSGDIYRKWLTLRYKHLQPCGETVRLLNALRKRYRLAVITNGPSRSQWEKIDRLRLRQLFDAILVSGDLQFEKPQRAIFDAACVYLNVEPRRCLMIGDKLETDILGGKRANLGGTVWIPLRNSNAGGEAFLADNSSSSSGDRDLEPDYVIDDIRELEELLLKDGVRTWTELDRNKLDLNDCNSNGSDGS